MWHGRYPSGQELIVEFPWNGETARIGFKGPVMRVAVKTKSEWVGYYLLVEY